MFLRNSSYVYLDTPDKLPLDQDVYDAASWSAIVPLSEWSVRNNSNSIEFPDFTKGSWETNKLNMDINLKNGGGNTGVIV